MGKNGRGRKPVFFCNCCMTNVVNLVSSNSNNNKGSGSRRRPHDTNKRKGKRPRENGPINLARNNNNQPAFVLGNLPANGKRDKLVFTAYEGEQSLKFVKKVMHKDALNETTLDLCKDYEGPSRMTRAYVMQIVKNLLKEDPRYIAATFLITATINNTLRGFAICFMHKTRPDTTTKNVMEVAIICARGKHQVKKGGRQSSRSLSDHKYISGLGPKMMSCIIRFVAPLKINLIQLTSVPRSVASYKKMGFKRVWDACANDSAVERAALDRYKSYFESHPEPLDANFKQSMEGKLYTANIDRGKLDMIAMSKCIARRAAKFGSGADHVQDDQFIDKDNDPAHVIRFINPRVRVLEVHTV